jgi:hypothetical protein
MPPILISSSNLPIDDHRFNYLSSRPNLIIKTSDVHSTTFSGPEGPSHFGDLTPKTSRREALIRQPSYCKILDDLKDTEEKIANMKSERPDPDGPDSGQASSTTPHSSVQTITINGQQYQIVSPAAMQTAEAIQALASGAGASPPSPGDVVQYAATSQNGQTVFIPGTVASTPGGAHVISVGHHGGGSSPSGSSPTGSLDMMPRSSEETARKREIRLLKNREAARECRNKKKEYIKCLENRVAVLENQNKALIEELKSLKELYTGQKS